MKKSLILFSALLLLASFVAAQDINVTEFYSLDCPHCQNVESSGVLERVANLQNVTLVKYNVKTGEGYEKYQYYHELIPKMPEGWPLAIIETNESIEYLLGDKPIIDNLEKVIVSGEIKHETSWIEKIKQDLQATFKSSDNDNFSLATFSAITGAALIDSINPCAFGVLIFLMITLLNLGSRKRALKYGLIYSGIIFITYFLAGLGLFHILQKLTSIRDAIYIAVGIIVLLIGLIEFQDYLRAKKGKSAVLKISTKIKSFIEEKAKKGTLIAILMLGVIVALFELPCTGGIYLGIISLILESKGMGMLYLFIYNLIFVLPLIIITFLVYKGMSPELIQKWNSNERAWMRLASSIVMIVISIWLISIGI